jgi:hypothetical protein
LPNDGISPLISGGNHLTNASIAPVEIKQIEPLAARINAMTMGVISSRTNAGPALRRLSAPAIVFAARALVENETEPNTHFTLRSNRQ